MSTDTTLRHADITDAVTCIEDGAKVRITDFYTIEEGTRTHWLDGGTMRYLRPCLPDDPDLAIIGTYAIAGRFHRPWDLVWRQPIPWTEEHIENERTHWRKNVANFDLIDAIKSTQYPKMFERYRPLTNHERLLLADWRRDTDARIRAYEVTADHRDVPA